jgi:hypothetical protein
MEKLEINVKAKPAASSSSAYKWGTLYNMYVDVQTTYNQDEFEKALQQMEALQLELKIKAYTAKVKNY